MEPLPGRRIQKSMNAVVVRACEEHLKLLEEYRIALHGWRMARIHDPLNSQCPAVLAAIQRVEQLEHRIKIHQSEHGCEHDIPLQADL